ncbi:fumarylacetoacetate hydrolase family protein [Mycolicibacterium sp. 050158]|uniref:fumarylacetoacetate hydrolase family protein n=1 Tax=Mycolicibacterium sp. 050158 TaxID=3090602 RepID=UPI00299E7C67|nr:fumarylacetoacetate hydrolase family protein [Mycolicibacterium sp. 050158]MDX1888118.1 fumarylacetoacetate hydrolase family protein [Mycolicibacterium sp. 050158]
MKLAKFAYAGAIRTGIVDGDTVRAVVETLDELVAGFAPTPTDLVLPLEAVELLAPLTSDCRGVLCVGINYVEHQRESADTFSATIPEHPVVFFKTPSAVAAPFAPLVLDDRLSQEFDWEVELGVVIGVGGQNIPRERAGEHVFGYTVINDVTARDVQRRHQQWHLGKNVDASTPIGPWIVTVDEIGYPPRVDVSLELDGEIMQRAHTDDMIFDVADQIATVSRYVALRPGDVFATGTPSGVGFARTPARFLKDGDVLRTAISGVGELRNDVITKVTTPYGLVEMGRA